MIENGSMVRYKKDINIFGIMSFKFNSLNINIIVRYLFSDFIDLKHGSAYYTDARDFEKEWELVV